MLITNNGKTPVTMNLRDGSSYLLQPGVPTSVPDAATTMIDDSAVLIALFNAGTLTVTTDAGGAFTGFPTSVNSTDSALGKLLPVRAKVGLGGSRSLVDETGQAVGGGGASNKTAQRRARAALWNGPAWIQARTLAQEIALGTTNVIQGRRFRHSTNNQLYECVAAGTIGTAEPATWIPTLYKTASPYMTPVGGTAKFIALGVSSRAPRSDRPAPTVVNPGVNQIGSNPLFLPDGETTAYTLTAGMSSGLQAALPISVRNAAQKKLWMPGTSKFDFVGGGNPLLLRNINEPGNYATGKGLSFNFTAVSQSVGLAFTNNDGGPEIFVNDSPLTEDPFGLLDANGVWGSIIISFPEGYPNNNFRIVSGDNLQAIYTSAHGFLMPTVEAEYRLMMLADSIGNHGTNGKARYADSVMQRIASQLGANTIACMQRGSTGYVQTSAAGSDNAFNFLSLNPSPFPNGTADAIIFMHGNNDGGNLANGTTTKDMLKRVWDLAASQHPNAVIQICGLWGAPYAETDAGVVAEKVIYAAWQEWANPNSDFIGGFLNDLGEYDPHVRPAKRPLVSDNVSTSFGLDGSSGMHYQGNSHAMLGFSTVNGGNGDGIHPTMFGNIERARRIALPADANLARRGY